MPALTSEQVHQKLVAQFGDAVGSLSSPKVDAFCTFKPSHVVDICRYLKAQPDLAFDFLEDLTATDHPKENLIRVVYHFYSYRHRHLFVAKVELDRSKPEVDTVETVWKAANWLEREVYDLFGVTFVGHSDLRRIMLPDDWIGTPLRKDYVEAGGYQGVSNVRDNPLDLYLNLDREQRVQVAIPPVPAAASPVTAAPPAPTPKEG
jgi:NADH-quinone oxidoreductase subunit C